MNKVDFNVLLGKTFNKVVRDDSDMDGDRIVFYQTNGGRFELYHDPDCCESVFLSEIIGQLTDLQDSPILIATEEANREDPPLCDPGEEIESYTWTFYTLATAKGLVVLRWYGSSNGYYSETASLHKLEQRGQL